VGSELVLEGTTSEEMYQCVSVSASQLRGDICIACPFESAFTGRYCITGKRRQGGCLMSWRGETELMLGQSSPRLSQDISYRPPHKDMGCITAGVPYTTLSTFSHSTLASVSSPNPSFDIVRTPSIHPTMPVGTHLPTKSYTRLPFPTLHTRRGRF